jgi:hypothetical protein
MILSLMSPDTVRAIVERAVSQAAALGTACPEYARRFVGFDEARYFAADPLLDALAKAAGDKVRSTPYVMERAACAPVRDVLDFDPFDRRA